MSRLEQARAKPTIIKAAARLPPTAPAIAPGEVPDLLEAVEVSEVARAVVPLLVVLEGAAVVVVMADDASEGKPSPGCNI